METQRFILLAALAFVFIILFQNWQRYQAEKYPQTVSEVVAPANTAAPADPSSPNAPAVDVDVPASPGSAAQATLPAAVAPTTEGEIITVTTDLVKAQIDTAGGNIIHLELLEHLVNAGEPDNFVLFKSTAEDYYAAQSGLVGRGTDFPSHYTIFSAENTEYSLGANDAVDISLSWTNPQGVRFTKVFTFARDTYRIDIRYQIDNQSDAPLTSFFYGQLEQSEPTVNTGGGLLSGRLPSFTGGAYYTPETKYDKLSFDELAEKKEIETPSGWAAMLQHYFVGVWTPTESEQFRIYTDVNNRNAKPRYKIGYLSLTGTAVQPGAQAETGGALFAGPKDQDRLIAQDAEHLRLTVDYGWLTVIAEPLFWILKKIHGVVGNWGWAIILLTILVKAAFLPLSAASYKSMAKMKKLTPRLKTLKERYGDDKQRYQQAMMEMYKTEKVNPAGGCLPILIQIPVFIALYWVLLESVEMRHAPWALWIHDLSSPDPYYVLPLLMGGSMLVQQLLNPAPMDPLQQKIMMALPVVFTVFFLSFPAGLVLYWVLSNILSIAQQWLITRRYT